MTDCDVWTRDRFDSWVHDCACSGLTEFDAEGSISNGIDFYAFLEEVDYDGSWGSHVDASFGISDWHEAMKVLGVLENREMDDMTSDSGLYEGVEGSRLFIVLAYLAFETAVASKAEELYNSGNFEKLLVGYTDSAGQIGYFPNNKRFFIPEGLFSVSCENFTKVEIGRAGLSARDVHWLVFEGTRSKETDGVLINCRRVYLQGGEKDVNEYLEEVKARGVRAVS